MLTNLINNNNLLSKLYKSNSTEGELLRFALNNLVTDIIDEVVTTTEKRVIALAKITRNVELRWAIISKKIHVKCPSCGNVMYSNCARYRCYQCDLVSYIKSKPLLSICKSCISYKKECPGAINKDSETPIIVLNRNYKKKNNE